VIGYRPAPADVPRPPGARRAAAKAWAISGVSEQTREAVTAAAREAGMPVGAWVEQALGKTLAKALQVGGVQSPP
jgi:ABC-type sugar transport system substrate-binding protein